MKTIKILFGLALLCPTFVSAQNEAISQKHKLQLGTFAELQKEFQKNPISYQKNMIGVNFGVGARYALSNTFTIASGIGASISAYKYESGPMDYYTHFEDMPSEIETGKMTRYTLRLPLTLQTNLYKRKLFVSTGVELFKDLRFQTKAVYTDIMTHQTRKASYGNKGGAVDAQLMAGLGWNFNALNGNSFSLEGNLKMYILSGYSPATSQDIYSPSVRLN